MRCQCPCSGDSHTENNCHNRAYYHVTRDIFEPHDGSERFIERLELNVCPECKFPEDFNITKIQDREPFQLELPIHMGRR